MMRDNAPLPQGAMATVVYNDAVDLVCSKRRHFHYLNSTLSSNQAASFPVLSDEFLQQAKLL